MLGRGGGGTLAPGGSRASNRRFPSWLSPGSRGLTGSARAAIDAAVAGLGREGSLARANIDIVSWNVNGLRAAATKGFLPWLRGRRATFVGVQEVRAAPEDLAPELARPRGWHTGFTAATRKGYSGVGFFSKRRPDAVETTLGAEHLDAEARFQEVRLGALTVVNAYFPNGNGTTLPNGRRSNDRIPYKLEFYRAIEARLAGRVAGGERILVMGDFNTAPHPIDLARPRDNTKTSGFTEVERAEIARWLEAGWVDTFRALHPERAEAYSWWSQRGDVRLRNVGWRIDLILASPGALPFLRAAAIHAEVLGSDHCPVSVTVDRAVFEP